MKTHATFPVNTTIIYYSVFIMLTTEVCAVAVIIMKTRKRPTDTINLKFNKKQLTFTWSTLIYLVETAADTCGGIDN